MGLLTVDYYYYYYFFFFLKLQACHFGGALSVERSGLSCVSLVIKIYNSLTFVQSIYITISLGCL
jgi:hypothetical protein